MKSQRRHELQHNALADEIGQIGRFFRKHGTKVSWAVLIVAVIALGVVMLNRRSRSERISIQNRYDQAKLSASMMTAENRQQVIDSLWSLARQDTVGWIAADSLLELGRLYATEAVLAENADQMQNAIEQARQSYQQVLSRFSDLPAMTVAARLGLGKLAENQGQFDQARELYQQAVDTPGLEGYPIADHAREALNRIQNTSGQVQLASSRPDWLIAEEQARQQPTSAPVMGPMLPEAPSDPE